MESMSTPDHAVYLALPNLRKRVIFSPGTSRLGGFTAASTCRDEHRSEIIRMFMMSHDNSMKSITLNLNNDHPTVKQLTIDDL